MCIAFFTIRYPIILKHGLFDNVFQVFKFCFIILNIFFFFLISFLFLFPI
jgi:hypothetical protein